MATTSLPRLVVFNVPKAGTNTYVYRKDDGSVADGESDKFNELVKIEVERSKTNNKRVHLRFCQKNRYWQKNEDDESIVAVSTNPEEDTTKASCTLFEPVQQSDDVVYFRHVQTGWRVMLNNSTLGFYVDKNSVGAPIGFVDWDTLVKLPKHVAFLGDNDKYLKAYKDNRNYLQFSSNDPNEILSGYEVSLMRDGHVRIKSDQWGLYWRMAWFSIFADSDDATANDTTTLFWPVKIDENTIALKSTRANRFLKRLTDDGNDDYLHASLSNITKEARFKVQELVMDRRIYNVTFRMEDARIYNETPYVAGTTTVNNYADQEGSIAVSLKYTDTRSYYFTRSVSLTAGVTHTITAGIPGIGEAGIEVSAEISTETEWNDTKAESVEVSATGTVPVPAKSSAVVHYVGTRGTCDVPFSYTQRDRSSTDGKIMQTEQIDGVFTGVNNYGFQFTVEKYQPLPDQ
ncbi:hypothetical protein SASPL_139470 [Salvia splendens]|uniref:Agglutinin domain-containing protein n=1 Tax=Salvia splendens TaxID=180675 RepID=A0A8X8WNF8_SALSN|nr:uncharacterized protein LOC121769380 [Salvia splendens]KAG6398020.1 hypothetical protein SASPL_139470 [Salvia splendens]